MDEVAFNIFNNSNDNNDCDNNNDSISNNEPSIYVFGYGSLVWNPGFEYSKCITGYIRGYVRRFWQGNVTHRGTLDQPGRVVTLVEDKEGICWGCAYKVTGDLALRYLEQRECNLGGYMTAYTKFYPRVATEFSGLSGEAFPVLLYIATPSNDYWMGEDSLEKIAEQISTSSGPSGHNVEYLLRLAIFMREEIPGVHDEHLFGLEKLVREELIKRKVCIISVMGNQPQRINRDLHESQRRPINFEFTTKVQEKRLRCLNI
ncbi:CLUMA_CG001693, isoform A [Clunio marinus]|uniref:glutathione-specific gamma-glutamylcyclotransferase n=1 Tax=Clunio marinus TaxID=568069 RepID=A0A1J1HK31_9DIPT|nr:CLUMA_CG001693, isoform A [Clunio marinus]